jgi:hypothetical protein
MSNSREDITLPYDVFRGILGQTGDGPKGLAQVLVPEGMDNPVDESVVIRWREIQSPEVNARLDELIPILFNPLSVSRVSVVNESEGFVSFLTLQGDRDPEAPVWVCSYQDQQREMNVTRLPTLLHLARYLTYYITPGFPLSDSNLELSIPASAFLILCAIADLMRRRLYNSRLDHMTVSLSFTRGDISKVVGDAQENIDPRWLLPHLSSLLPSNFGVHLMDNNTYEFTWLEEHNYIVPGKNRGEYLCSDNCMDFLKLLNASTCRQGIIKLHQGKENGVMMESVCIVREPRAIFAITIGNDKESVIAVLLTLNFGQLLDFTMAFLSETGIRADTAPAYQKNQKTSSPTGQIEKITCPHCNAPLPASARFCRKCGNPVNPESH